MQKVWWESKKDQKCIQVFMSTIFLKGNHFVCKFVCHFHFLTPNSLTNFYCNARKAKGLKVKV